MFIINVVIREVQGFRYIPIRQCDTHPEAEAAVAAYVRRNPGLTLMIDHVAPDEEEIE